MLSKFDDWHQCLNDAFFDAFKLRDIRFVDGHKLFTEQLIQFIKVSDKRSIRKIRSASRQLVCLQKLNAPKIYVTFTVRTLEFLDWVFYLRGKMDFFGFIS